MGVATSAATFFRQMGGTLGAAVFLSILFSTVQDKIAEAYKAAAGTADFQAALRDPAVLADPANAPVLGMLRGVGSGSQGSMLSDTSFLAQLDERLALPFRVGFSDSIDLVLVCAVAVLSVTVVLTLFVPERALGGRVAQVAEGTSGAVGGAPSPGPGSDTGGHADDYPCPTSGRVLEEVPLRTLAVEYPFPLRPGLQARLVLPEDLSDEEADRLCAHIRTLAVAPGWENTDPRRHQD